MGPQQVQTLRFRVDLGAMEMMRYTTFPKSPHVILFSSLPFSYLNFIIKLFVIYLKEIKKTKENKRNRMVVGYHNRGWHEAPFSLATTPMCTEGRYSFPLLLHFTLDPYLIMLSKAVSSTIFWVFGIPRPGIELRCNRYNHSKWKWTQDKCQ